MSDCNDSNQILYSVSKMLFQLKLKSVCHMSNCCRRKSTCIEDVRDTSGLSDCCTASKRNHFLMRRLAVKIIC